MKRERRGGTQGNKQGRGDPTHERSKGGSLEDRFVYFFGGECPAASRAQERRDQNKRASELICICMPPSIYFCVAILYTVPHPLQSPAMTSREEIVCVETFVKLSSSSNQRRARRQAVLHRLS